MGHISGVIMLSFKKAAIKILESEGKPLNYRELTRMAIEQNLIETSGATPEQTMNAVIGRDIKYNKSDSPFLRDDGKGVVELRPDYKKILLDDYSEDEIELDGGLGETTNSHYLGKAGEHMVASELLFLGYNVNNVNVDEGVDIVATKGGKYFNIQVKLSNENSFGRYSFTIPKSSFDRFESLNTFYIFVLRRTDSKDTKRKIVDFLILSSADIKKYYSQRHIGLTSNGKYALSVMFENGETYLGKKDNNVRYHLNAWHLLQDK